MVHEYSKQPWKGLYLAFEVLVTSFVRLPVWAVTYAFPSALPRPTWSWRHAMAVALLRRVTTTAALVGGFGPVPDHRAVTPAKDAEGVWIDGVPYLITAELKIWSTLSDVEPIRIPGYWFGRKGISCMPSSPVQSGEKVFIFFHGGGYTVECAHPVGGLANIVRALIELNSHTPRALAVEYRLSSTHPLPDRHPFPTALLDALAGYNYLVKVVGYNPRDIVVAGDSAGGNLALALVRYLIENGSATEVSLPGPPGSLLLLSPWTDLSDSHDTPGSSSLINTEDFLDDLAKGSFVSYCKQAFLGPHGLGMASCNRYISPASLYPSVQAHFNSFPRTFISAGGAERFLDQIRTLKEKMVTDMGADKVTYYEATDTIHDWLAFPWDPACPATLMAIQQWLA
ncbi:Alpha/Beta hydrolase protein [Pisolithus thermaeus]|nr:Alpha/Beta hydrolase protein [Pisolithus croceorrhizus]KAI6163825.1 Alpha/Beta hydrolase protein [Pisolithus thermaeus]